MINIRDFKTYSISNLLIAISFIATSAAISMPELYNYWINSFFLNQGFYNIFIIQLFTGVFIHWWISHLLSNSLFIYFFWNIVENTLWIKKYLILLFSSIIITGISLILFTQWNTIWISWFAMTLLWFYTTIMFMNWNNDYKWWITAILIYVWIWFMPWISLVGHLSGVIIGIIFWLFYRK
jgi:membrane associated rhomboid family serine protease